MLLLLTTPAFSELTPADIDKIRLIVKEEVAASEARMRKDVETSETRVKDQISIEISKVNSTISEMDKRLNQIFMLVIALVVFSTVTIDIPQIIVAMQRKDQRAQNEKIDSGWGVFGSFLLQKKD